MKEIRILMVLNNSNELDRDTPFLWHFLVELTKRMNEKYVNVQLGCECGKNEQGWEYFSKCVLRKFEVVVDRNQFREAFRHHSLLQEIDDTEEDFAQGDRRLGLPLNYCPFTNTTFTHNMSKKKKQFAKDMKFI